MLKKIKRETDIITNVDLFNEIVLRVKESESWHMRERSSATI